MNELNKKLQEKGLDYSIRKVSGSKRFYLFKGEAQTSVKFNDVNGAKAFLKNCGIIL